MMGSTAWRRALAALAGGLALAGCSATHVGESWQCPLAQGASCDSVAAADPAVPDSAATREPVLRAPLYEVRGAADAPPAARPCDAGCGFDPLAWLARLLGVDGDGDGASEAPDAGASDGAGARDGTPPRGEAEVPAPVEESRTPAAAEEMAAVATMAGAAPGGASPAPAVLLPPERTAPPAASSLSPMPDAGGGLRTGEVIGRIWIAPFVDSGGVYREASHVRVVLEPAGWRLK